MLVICWALGNHTLHDQISSAYYLLDFYPGKKVGGTLGRPKHSVSLAHLHVVGVFLQQPRG